MWRPHLDPGWPLLFLKGSSHLLKLCDTLYKSGGTYSSGVRSTKHQLPSPQQKWEKLAFLFLWEERFDDPSPKHVLLHMLQKISDVCSFRFLFYLSDSNSFVSPDLTAGDINILGQLPDQSYMLNRCESHLDENKSVRAGTDHVGRQSLHYWETLILAWQVG